MNTVKMSAAVSVNKGKVRSNNEDNFYLNGQYLTPKNRDKTASYIDDSNREIGLYGIFDGMGGEALGEEASLIAAETVFKAHKKAESGSSSDKTVLSAIKDANAAICKKILESGEKRIGTTFVALKIENDTARVYNVGDSRVYRLRNGELTQISVDDTTAQRLVNMGMITKEKAKTHEDRHKLTQHLGIFPNEMVIEAHKSQELELKKGDKFLLCSDGLTDMVEDEKIEEILKKSADSEETTKLLVDEALANGGKDNITVMVICILSNSKQRSVHSKNRFMLPIIGIVAVCIAAGGIGVMKHHKSSNAKYEETDPVKLESVYFSGIESDTLYIPIGKEDFFRCGTEPADADKRKAEFSSSENDVIAVEKNGGYIAKSTGESEISVKLNECEARISVFVYDFSVDESIKLGIGENVNIKIQVSPTEAQPEFAYSSSDESIVSVDNGIVTGVKSGSAEIVVSADGVEKRIGVIVEGKAQGKSQGSEVTQQKKTPPQAPPTSPDKKGPPEISDTTKPKDEKNDNTNQKEQEDTIKQEEPKSNNE